jgi:uncharacterized protein
LTRFLPRRVRIESFGNGGFRFGEMSHQGSLLVLPSGMRAWEPGDIANVSAADFGEVLAERDDIDFLVIGTGPHHERPAHLASYFAGQKINVEFMATAPAINVYNVVLSEGRRVAAALIALA